MGLSDSPACTTWHIIVTMYWPGDMASWRCPWCAVVRPGAMGCVRLMVVERGGGCG